MSCAAAPSGSNASNPCAAKTVPSFITTFTSNPEKTAAAVGIASPQPPIQPQGLLFHTTKRAACSGHPNGYARMRAAQLVPFQLFRAGCGVPRPPALEGAE